MLAASPTAPADRKDWLGRLRSAEQARRRADAVALASEAEPIHPARVCGELQRRLAPDALLVADGDGGLAARYLPARTPGSFLVGARGCRGVAPGYGLAACLAHPDRQV